MSLSLLQRVSRYLGYSEYETLALALKAPTTYRHYRIPKKKVGFRTIHHPSKQTKALQYAIIELLLKNLAVHEAAVAYRGDIRSPLLKNALAHAPLAYSVRVDFSDFFHSIRPQDLFHRIEAAGIGLSPKDQILLEHCLFVSVGGEKGLAIGAPSSPIISNITLYDIDEQLKAHSRAIADDAVYTRYADDIVFSTNAKGACKEFYAQLCHVVDQETSPKLRVNKAKTVFSSRASRRVVTGLVLEPSGAVSLGRRKKRFIKKLLCDLKHGKLPDQDRAYLGGYLAHVLDVEPEFFNRLTLKYNAELVTRALRGD